MVFPSLEEFSTVCCDPHKGFDIVNEAEVDVFQDGRRGKIVFRIKLQSRQRGLEAESKTLVCTGPRHRSSVINVISKSLRMPENLPV